MLQPEMRKAALVLAAAVGIGVVVELFEIRFRPDLQGFGAYPLGLLAVALLLVTSRRATLQVAAAAAVSTTVVLWAGNQTLVEALGYSTGGVLAGLAVLPLLRPHGRRIVLHSEVDLLRLLAAAVVGTAVLALTVTVGSTLAGAEGLLTLVLASAVNQLASLILWMPLALAAQPDASIAGRRERLVQWLAVLAVTVGVYGFTDMPLAYLVLLVLAWAGLRLSLAEAVIQLIAVRALTVAFTEADRGPHAPSALGLDLVPDLESVFATLFLIACSVAVVALNLSNTRQRAAIRRLALAEAGAAADRQLISMVEALEAERGMVEQLRELDRVKDTFVSMVSHELRTPITNIMGYAELLEEGEYGDLSSVQTRVLQRVEENSQRLLMLIDDLLTLSRLQSAHMEFERAPVDLVEVVRTAERITLPRVRSAGLSLEMDLPTASVMIEGDRGQLERVLVNLMSNAVKFTPGQGTIRVCLRGQDETAVISVRDTGLGISAEDQEQLFTRFFRSAEVQERHIPGTGLGLSIVQSIVEGHGGDVTVDAAVGQGAEFRVTLPLSEAPRGPDDLD